MFIYNEQTKAKIFRPLSFYLSIPSSLLSFLLGHATSPALLHILSKDLRNDNCARRLPLPLSLFFACFERTSIFFHQNLKYFPCSGNDRMFFCTMKYKAGALTESPTGTSKLRNVKTLTDISFLHGF